LFGVLIRYTKQKNKEGKKGGKEEDTGE